MGAKICKDSDATASTSSANQHPVNVKDRARSLADQAAKRMPVSYGGFKNNI